MGGNGKREGRKEGSEVMEEWRSLGLKELRSEVMEEWRNGGNGGYGGNGGNGGNGGDGEQLRRETNKGN